MSADASGDLTREVLINGPVSRKELSSRLGLSPASLTRLSRPLIDAGLLVDMDIVDGGVGRPSKSLDVQLDSRNYAGIKLTSTRVFAVCTDIRANVLRSAEKVLENHNPQHISQQVKDAVEAAAYGRPIDCAGVTLGGQVAGSVVVSSPFLELRDFDLGATLSKTLGVRVVLENDVTALTAAQHWFGVGRGVTDFATVTVGVGVGYGLISHGRLAIGADNGLGCHLVLDQDGDRCGQGHLGCAAAVLSSDGMLSQYKRFSGLDVSFEEFIRATQSSEEFALQTMRSAANSLGHLCAAIANLARVDMVAVAGENAGLFESFRELVLVGFQEHRTVGGAAVALVFDDEGFGAWARSAAAVAIRASFGVLE